jgi:hypothetical protein
MVKNRISFISTAAVWLAVGTPLQRRDTWCLEIIDPLGRVGFKISQPGDWPVPTFLSLRNIHNQGGEITSNGRSESFFFPKLTKSNPTRPRGIDTYREEKNRYWAPATPYREHREKVSVTLRYQCPCVACAGILGERGCGIGCSFSFRRRC